VLQLPDDFVVTALLADSRGDLWIGGPYGLLHCDGQACRSLHFGDDDAWGDPHVITLAEDSQGHVWGGGRGWLGVYDPVGG
jgi:ligand-binding sensor domain-containing protein